MVVGSRFAVKNLLKLSRAFASVILLRCSNFIVCTTPVQPRTFWVVLKPMNKYKTVNLIKRNRRQYWKDPNGAGLLDCRVFRIDQNGQAEGCRVVLYVRHRFIGTRHSCNMPNKVTLPGHISPLEVDKRPVCFKNS